MICAQEEEERSRHFLSHLSEAFWTCIQFASDQLSSIPKTEAMRTHTARWILSFLGLFALFLLRLYENGLLAELITTNKVTPFRSTAELAEKMVAGKAEWAYVADTVFDSLLLDPRITAMNAMREAIKEAPARRVGNNAEGMELVRSLPAGEVGFHVSEELAKSVVECGETFVRDSDLPVGRSAFILNKHNHKLRERLNEVINMAASHNQYVVRRYDRPNYFCPPKEQNLQAHNLVGVFMIAGGFVFLALVTLGIEGFCHRWKGKGTNKRRYTSADPFRVIEGASDTRVLDCGCEHDCGLRRRRPKTDDSKMFMGVHEIE